MRLALITLTALGFAMFATPASAACNTYPDSMGGYRTTCSDGSSAVHYPDPIGGTRSVWSDPSGSVRSGSTYPDPAGGWRTTGPVPPAFPPASNTTDPYGWPR